MSDTTSTITLSIEMAVEREAVFDTLIEELTTSLAGADIHVQPGDDGRVMQGEHEVGRVVAWRHGERVVLRWRPADWAADEVTEVEIRFDPIQGGTRITLEHRGWGRLIGSAGDLVGWFAGQAVSPLLQATAPSRFGDWLTDRGARRPTGAQARATYSDPLYHYPNFRVLLSELALSKDDHLLEVGCGGGAFLKEALQSGCRAAAIDHSPDMVRTARERNADAVAAGRLTVHEATASTLPFADASFTCAAMTGVLGFLTDPVAVFAEISRVLVAGGRLVVAGSDPALKGTPAAPEPMASRLRFYDDDQLAKLAVDAGFADVQVVRRNLEPHAREVGVPEEHLSLFAGPAPFLLARRGG